MRLTSYSPPVPSQLTRNITVAHQYNLSAPLYTKRAAVIKRIPHFWPLVFEQAPEDIDTYIQPSDSEILASCLSSFDVSRPDVKSHPRNVTFRFTFSENEFFADTVLEKNFYARTADDGDRVLVSEPVRIAWKQGKDLTNGLLEGAAVLHAAVLKGGADVKEKELKEYAALKQQVENAPEGAQSFFAWFGYRGPWVSQATSDANDAKVKSGAIPASPKPANGLGGDADDEEELGFDDDDEYDLEAEIFPDGDELAMALSEDLWPNALRYFADAQQQDEMDMEDLASLEDDELEEMEMDVPDIRSLVKDAQITKGGKGEEKEAPPKKKRKT